MNFLIIRKGDYRPNRNYEISTIPGSSIVGTINIDDVSELVSEGTYKYKGIFNRVNEYDSVVYSPQKNKNIQSNNKQ